MKKTQKDTENRRSVLNRTQTIMDVRCIIISFNADFDEFLISVIFSICQYFILNTLTSHARVFNAFEYNNTLPIIFCHNQVLKQ